MPYADKDAQREYQRRWMIARRGQYLNGRACVLCGSTDSLEIDHSNPQYKVSHRIWSWAKPRLEAELAKCVIVCRRCHAERHALERTRTCGTRGGYDGGCRCDDCKAAKASANRRQREKNRTGRPTGRPRKVATDA